MDRKAGSLPRSHYKARWQGPAFKLVKMEEEGDEGEKGMKRGKRKGVQGGGKAEGRRG